MPRAKNFGLWRGNRWWSKLGYLAMQVADGRPAGHWFYSSEVSCTI